MRNFVITCFSILVQDIAERNFKLVPAPDQMLSRATLHTVAKLHYEADLSQVEIAKRLGVSTATISRMLQRARAEGIVRIEIRDLASPDALTSAVVDALGLKRAAVVEAPAPARWPPSEARLAICCWTPVCRLARY